MPHDPAPAQKKTTTSTETTTLPLHHPGGQRRQNSEMQIRIEIAWRFWLICVGARRGEPAHAEI